MAPPNPEADKIRQRSSAVCHRSAVARALERRIGNVTNSVISSGLRMLYTFLLVDKPGALAKCLEIRPQHKAYLGAKAEQIAFAGPLMSDDGTSMVGSLLVIDFPSREEAQRWIAAEPFTQAGVYASTTVYAFENLWPQRAGFPPSS
jgi:uncharacterized protein YciI